MELYLIGMTVALVSTAFVYAIVHAVITGEIKCVFGRHDYQYSGVKSWMVWRDGYQGVNGGESEIYKCSRCGKVK